MSNGSPTSTNSSPPPGIEPYHSQLVTLESRSYATYRARLQASIRLARRSRAWNTSLISLSTSTTVAAIGMLTDPGMYGKSGDVIMVCVAVLALVVSLVTSGLDYSGRSRNMFLNYRRIQRLSARAERAKVRPELQTARVVERLNGRYDGLLDESENHTPADHLRLQDGQRWSIAVLREDALTLLPYLTLALPIALLVPLARHVFG